MGSSAIDAVGSGLTTAITWVGQTFSAFGSNGAFAPVMPILGVLCGLGIATWGINKVSGLVRSIG